MIFLNVAVIIQVYFEYQEFLIFCFFVSQVLSQGKEVVLQSQVSAGATLTINAEVTFETCTR